MLIEFCINNKANLYKVFFEAENLKFLHDKEGNLSANGVKFINTLAYKSAQLENMDKGFPKISKTTMNTIEPELDSFNDKLYYDEFEEEKYTYGSWFVFPIRGVLSPCNDWF